MAKGMPEDNLGMAFESLSKAYHEIPDGLNVNPIVKMKLIKAAQNIIDALQSPLEAGQIFAMRNAVHPCYRIAADCGLLTELSKESKPFSAKQLADNTGADECLIIRVMRVLTASGVCKEEGEGIYSHNALSTFLSDTHHIAIAKFVSPAIARLPEYLSLTSYRNPGSMTGSSTPFQYGNSTPLPFYNALGLNPSARSGLDAQMRAHVQLERSNYKAGFASIYDFEGIVNPLISDETSVAIVDMGGSKGHVLEDVRVHIPQLKGRLILQDLPEVLWDVDIDEVELMSHDFLKDKQPVVGAVVYLFRQIFLNWNDEKGLQILKNTRNALEFRHSRLLIMEPVLPSLGAPLPQALLDIQMSQMGGGLRTQKQWKHFLHKAGFVVARFLEGQSGQTVIEAFRADTQPNSE